MVLCNVTNAIMRTGRLAANETIDQSRDQRTDVLGGLEYQHRVAK
jgi:hypothetical protein